MHRQNNKQLTDLEKTAKVLELSENISPYNPELVAMIKKANKRGSYKEINLKDVWGSLNIK